MKFNNQVNLALLLLWWWWWGSGCYGNGRHARHF